mmetsp:Transcript_16754/g.36009  ORF Transcript_16754/g.36009 Transcript_16754/m.36009 type:complete len:600 (-) Transcript_16754:138-1937(-)
MTKPTIFLISLMAISSTGVELVTSASQACESEGASTKDKCADLPPADNILLQRRARFTSSSSVSRSQACRTAAVGDTCYKAVMWVLQHGLLTYPEWYPGLSANPTFEDVQLLLHTGGHGPELNGPSSFQGCNRPCLAEAQASKVTPTATWVKLEKINCFFMTGANTAGDEDPVAGVIGYSACEAACLAMSECTAFVLPADGEQQCYLRKDLCPSECLPNPYWHTYVMTGTQWRQGCDDHPLTVGDYPAVQGVDLGLASTTTTTTTEKATTTSTTAATKAATTTTTTKTTTTTTTAEAVKTTKTTTAKPEYKASATGMDTSGDLSPLGHSDIVGVGKKLKDMSYQASAQKVGDGWCEVEAPVDGWSLEDSCTGGFRVKVLSYNLFWWNLFGVRAGNDGSAGKMIAKTSELEAYDIMGFQECQDVNRVLNDAGFLQDYTGLQWSDGDIAIALAYRTDRFAVLSTGHDYVGEDRPEQHYGRRGAQWLRLQDKKSGRTVTVVNHHGPLPVNSGGICGGQATAYHLLKLLAEHAEVGDGLVLMGDLNADTTSVTQQTLGQRMFTIKNHWVDAIYASCAGEALKESAVLDNGGSDHSALSATLEF